MNTTNAILTTSVSNQQTGNRKDYPRQIKERKNAFNNRKCKEVTGRMLIELKGRVYNIKSDKVTCSILTRFDERCLLSNYLKMQPGPESIFNDGIEFENQARYFLPKKIVGQLKALWNNENTGNESIIYIIEEKDCHFTIQKGNTEESHQLHAHAKKDISSV